MSTGRGRGRLARPATAVACGLAALAALAPEAAAGAVAGASGSGPLAAGPAAATSAPAVGNAVPGATPGAAAGGAGAAAGGGAGTQAAEFPPMSQTLSDVRQNGCRKPAARAADRPSWSQVFLRPEAVWPLSRGAGVTVAVIGSGVDAGAGSGSGALAGRLTLGPRLHGDGDAGRDCVGHGTALATLVAGRRPADGGPSGVAPAAKVLAVAATDDAGSTNVDLLARGIRAAADAGARIGLVGAPIAEAAPALADAVGYATAKGMLLVAPVGPDNQAVNVPVYPAGYPGVLAVAAIGSDGAPAGAGVSDSGGGSAGSAGSAGQAGGAAAALGPGRTSRVDVTAPGEGLLAAGPGGGTFTATGPSYAAALVAGTAALVLGRSPSLTVEQLADRLRSTAYRPGTALPDPAVGWGAVDPVTAVGAPAAAGAAAAAGSTPAATADPVVVPPPPDGRPVRLASAVTGVSLGGAALLGLAAAAARVGRRRAAGRNGQDGAGTPAAE
ncbi:S8 family serine peptidase [Kitasatospora purpeofusca]|uniref:S8 family serine peptidase n=1 Tax=Kitasatospora purpeofusca TaxID=67352 RepID=UPI00225687F9|nr:S8 family serine peptidase [Kitasatospora purpeofusca]MCX4684092.1 S8 family serine peptidase [Kitasatospora purpeofusca]